MNAYLLLANGMVFAGQSVGAEGVTVGEVVFATGMVGFQETLTDPSYYGQIITQTYPLIGNYGMNKDDMESDRIWAKGYIVREACTTPSNWRCEETLDSFLKKNNTIGIEGIDTRHLLRFQEIHSESMAHFLVTSAARASSSVRRMSRLRWSLYCTRILIPLWARVSAMSPSSPGRS